MDWKEVEQLPSTSRGNGGLGSTGQVVLAKAEPLSGCLGIGFPRRPVVMSRLPGPPLRGQNENTRGTSR